MPHHILVADDDPHIREVIAFALEKAGMVTQAVADGAAALRAFEQRTPGLVVLDVGMPEMDGLEVCRLIRRTSDVPILFLSARDEEIDRILGLEMGGDDYVTKPFSPRELVARVNVILRRARPQPAGDVPAPPPLAHGRLSLDPASRTARTTAATSASRRSSSRSSRACSPGRRMCSAAPSWSKPAMPPASIFRKRTIDSHIRNIRAKLAEAGATDAIETVHGVGFRLGRCGG